MTGTKPIKHPVTPEMDAVIRRVYRTEGTGSGEVRELARRLGLPRWKVSRRALELGVRESKIKESPWSETELRILERNAHLSPQRISIRLARVGYRRTATAVTLKLKRLRLRSNLNGMSARQTAECFGVDAKTVTRWISLGLLRADRRGTERVAEQGGDMWFIREKYLRRFVLENLNQVDLRKVDKYWFVDLITGGDSGQTAADRG
jgi:hypothetical protein